MPVSFSRLRIAGFKSFAEPAILEIRPGLTGIVGPNGCGKSNVVEALRWAMGESSARSLRGGEMDDVIFAGTAARPSRNIAEVTLAVDDATGIAPPPFHDAPDLEITRRIERGSGSGYRVNGREARARDVQTLFADLASGARSSAMVSQGRVGAIVAARPEERRALLEEAAGITGLHARRHEAELKLKAAEANLDRAEDLRTQLEGQLESLKRQAQQAARYRTVSRNIRAAEAEFLALQRARAEAGRAAAAAAWHAARQAVAEATLAATGAGTRATEAAAALPALRSAEAEARTALERHRVRLESFLAEERRAADALAGARARTAQVSRDLAHAEQAARDAKAALLRLTEEASRLATEDAAHPARLERAQAAATDAADAARIAEADANRATEHAADLAARHRAATETLSAAEQRARRVQEQQVKLGEEKRRLGEQVVDPSRLAATKQEHLAAEQAASQARAAAEQAEQARAATLQQAAATRAAAHGAAERARTAAQAALAGAREAALAAESARTKLAAEAQALAEVLAVRDGNAGARIVDALTVPAGLEAAIGAALGPDLEASTDRTAARHFADLPPFDAVPALPSVAKSFTALMDCPPSLGRALGQIGLVEDDADGRAAHAWLAPGQSLVSRAGGVWRWDGLVVAAGTPSEAAVRLQQRNRLADLRTRLGHAEQVAATARAARADAEAAERAARQQAETDERTARAEADAAERAATTAEAQARTARRVAEQLLDRARTAHSELAAQAAGAAAKLAALDDSALRLEADVSDAAAALRAARDNVQQLGDPTAARSAMERARQTLAAARAKETATRGERDAIARAAAGRAHRARTLANERADWAAREHDGRGRVADLAARAGEAQAALSALEAEPAHLAARRAAAMDGMAQAEASHATHADALARAESEAAAAERDARAAEAALSMTREAVARAEGEHAQAEQALAVVGARIVERLGPHPALPDPPADRSPDSEEKARRRLERLQREREEIGPVNLRADVEAEEIATQVATIVREREELATAIAKLRGSIGHLNREGRERLAQVFADVDRNFQALFARNFGGGKAHLALVGSDDPLLAGLEIYAQPPGKKLAALSLLSGGEQALTALSLIFAVFRCNPAPVCVLDEVDAPLDDANVHRFCALLEDMVRETGTRFLVVTHHHVTMARMDRLYGVTMQERGISRLLSVDLRQATDMVEPARLAAE